MGLLDKLMSQFQQEMGKTNIQVDEEIADLLHDMKERGDSYNDVLRRMLIKHGYLEEDDN